MQQVLGGIESLVYSLIFGDAEIKIEKYGHIGYINGTRGVIRHVRANALDWNYNDRYIAAVMGTGGSPDTLNIFKFESETGALSFLTSVNPAMSGSNTSTHVAWHPSDNFVAVDTSSSTKVVIYELYPNETLSVETTWSSVGNPAHLVWTNDGEYLIAMMGDWIRAAKWDSVTKTLTDVATQAPVPSALRPIRIPIPNREVFLTGNLHSTLYVFEFDPTTETFAELHYLTTESALTNGGCAIDRNGRYLCFKTYMAATPSLRAFEFDTDIDQLVHKATLNLDHQLVNADAHPVSSGDRIIGFQGWRSGAAAWELIPIHYDLDTDTFEMLEPEATAREEGRACRVSRNGQWLATGLDVSTLAKETGVQVWTLNDRGSLPIRVNYKGVILTPHRVPRF